MSVFSVKWIAFFVIWMVILIWRLGSSCTSLLDHSFSWVKDKITGRSKVSLVAFVIKNFTTAVIYYIVCFDNAVAFYAELDLQSWWNRLNMRILEQLRS